jgi:DNA-binding protein
MKKSEPRTVYVPSVAYNEQGFINWMKKTYPDFKNAVIVAKEVRRFKTAQKPNEDYIMSAMRFIETAPNEPVTLRSRGAAISRAVSLANRLVESYGLQISKVELSQTELDGRKVPQIAIILIKTQK